MKLKRNAKFDEYGITLEDELSLDCFKGGKGGTTVQQPQVNPTPPVEDASVELSSQQEDLKRKSKAGKGALKIPLATEVNTGLNTTGQKA